MGMTDTNISDLPDCILHYILSLLPSDDVVRTSILAKRWHYFWTFLSSIDIKFRHRWVDSLYLPNGIHFPLLKTLNLSHVIFANENSAQQLFSGCPLLQELTLYNCYWWNTKKITIAISTLRMLTIHFDTCCSHYDDYHNCIVKIECINLVSLSCTSNPTTKFVSINLSSIVEAYIDLKTDFPQCVDYAVDCTIQLLGGLNSIKSLILSNDTLEFLNAKDTLHHLPPFHNLTHLRVLMGEHYETSETLKDFLSKTPKLEVLKIPKGLDCEIGTLTSVPCCIKSSLKLVYISDFYGDEDEIELVKFLLENATALREIQIFWAECITSDLELLAHIKNQLRPSLFSKCVIEFQ